MPTMTWRPFTLILALVLANLLVFGALGVWAFTTPSPSSQPTPRATFTPNPALDLRFATPTATLFPTLAPPPTPLVDTSPYEYTARRTHGRY